MAVLGNDTHLAALQVRDLKTNPNYGDTTEQNPTYTIITYVTFPSKGLGAISIILSIPIWTC